MGQQNNKASNHSWRRRGHGCNPRLWHPESSLNTPTQHHPIDPTIAEPVSDMTTRTLTHRCNSHHSCKVATGATLAPHSSHENPRVQPSQRTGCWHGMLMDSEMSRSASLRKGRAAPTIHVPQCTACCRWTWQTRHASACTICIVCEAHGRILQRVRRVLTVCQGFPNTI